jgi:uncharacterized protein
MELEEQINADIKSAMLAKEKQKLEALRAVKAAILLAKTQKGNQEVDSISLLQRLVKQRKESAEIYMNQGRKDLADEEQFQADVIQKYLPEPLSEEELRKEVSSVIAECGATGMKDIGKVMGICIGRLAGKADNKTLAALVRKLLSE